MHQHRISPAALRANSLNRKTYRNLIFQASAPDPTGEGARSPLSDIQTVDRSYLDVKRKSFDSLKRPLLQSNPAPFDLIKSKIVEIPCCFPVQPSFPRHEEISCRFFRMDPHRLHEFTSCRVFKREIFGN